jgi:hypothetical protein
MKRQNRIISPHVGPVFKRGEKVTYLGGKLVNLTYVMIRNGDWYFKDEKGKTVKFKKGTIK